MRVKFYIPGHADTLFEYSLEMPCRVNQGDVLNLEDLIDVESLDNDEKKAVAKESFYVKMTAFHKDEDGIYQFAMLARGSETE